MQQEGNECFVVVFAHLLYLPTFITHSFGPFPLVFNFILCDEAYGNKRITCITKQLLLFFLPGVALTCVVEQRVDPRRAGMSVLAIIIAIFTRPLANHLRVLQNYSFPFTLIPYMHFGSSSITN